MAKICMNKACQATTTFQWKEGWGLKSGAFATLCFNCGSAYENLLYCETFHLEESGWRECRLCQKYLYDYLDFGGIGCISCTKTNNIGDLQSSYVEHIMGGISLDKEKFTQWSKSMNENELNNQIKRVKLYFLMGKLNAGFLDRYGDLLDHLFCYAKNNRPMLGEKDMYKSLAQPSTSLIFSNPLETPYSVLPSPGGAVEEREQNKVPHVKQGKKTRLILPKPPTTGLTVGSDANRGMVSQMRVLRLPDEGRGQSPLYVILAKGYRRRTATNIWRKVLSASDASQIGCVVLPKACAEAYFPPISQSEGIPIKIQDIKGKEWTFQFRFWPNNKSRMYVLEGINPCIQNMELQAGDIVTFIRIDPGGKLVIAFRKASNFINLQDSRVPALSDGAPSRKISTEYGGRTNEDSLQQPMLIPGKKRAQNIGSKNKRLLMHGEDELLRPPPSAKPTIVMIEDQEFQEYDILFGKSTIFTSRASGEQEQWAQCDSCSKWRVLLVDVLIPTKWACLDNIWDPSRCSCFAPDEMNPQELESLLSVGNDFKKLRIIESTKVDKEHEPSGLDALANAAVLEDIANDLGEPSAGTTTKHPCDHSGCSCIVCIQLPSGKGKHKSTCTCNACFSLKCPSKTFTSG
ncbi:B3 domain-containing transcription repressor VAL1 [Camellia lanceoleosa]|uniref:B3 domain-containing transcription repressor VAL1 n=1 Tax=Camellia lanceoleosa TaxID=1840588 RepID=A0ACC0F5D1_9ERIC|nr:B3 domain-containing transcription repressor VAL1 [Camellia lanceoleosa]